MPFPWVCQRCLVLQARAPHSSEAVDRRRLEVFKRLLDFVGVPSGRTTFAWVSASEGAQFAALATEVAKLAKEAGPNAELVRQRQDLEDYMHDPQ